MSTSHDLFLFSRWVDPFLMIVQLERLLATFLLGSPSLLCLRSQVSSSGVGPEVTSCPHHPFIGCEHLISIGQPSSFVLTFYHEHAILSYPCLGFLMLVFPQGSLPRAGRSCAIPTKRLPASLLGSLRCHLLQKPLANASLRTSFLSKAQNLFFYLYGPGSSLLHF